MRPDPSSVCLVFFACCVVSLVSCFSHAIAAAAFGGAVIGDYRVPVNDGLTVRKDGRWTLMSTEFGKISAVKINDGKDGGCYHIRFITLEPQSLFLPVQLFSEMVLYVNAGNGTLSWIDVGKDDHELQEITLQKGDIFRLQPQTVFYIQNTLKSEDPKKLQIYAVFSDSESELQSKQFTKAYAGVQDLVLGFDNKVLQATLNVSGEVMKELRGGEGQTLIVQGQAPEANNSMSEVVSHPFTRAFLGINHNNGLFDFLNKKKKDKKKDKKKKDKKREDKRSNNIFEADHDIETPNGWSVTLNHKQLDAFQDSDFGVFMVNITKGSMMAPHWNPKSVEIAIVLQGEGMVQVVCPMVPDETLCKNSRFKVEEGDVFVVPRYHQMAQMSFNNDSFVFMGFKMTPEDNPTLDQFLTGKTSVLQTLDKTMLAKSFHISNTTLMDEVLSAEKESILIECASCAEDEERLMEEEREGGWSEWQKMEAESELARRQEAELLKRLKEQEEAAAKVRRPEVEIGTYVRQCKCTCMCNV
uniref:vicilin-like seed storage protein At2g18540 n=1 Tax=Erigeron canadensis TaxID=72917 RepID=UPI001CB8FF17|nr:vicilin-like seed storage protein At2g18540 [Erigeron canadensis]